MHLAKAVLYGSTFTVILIFLIIIQWRMANSRLKRFLREEVCRTRALSQDMLAFYRDQLSMLLTEGRLDKYSSSATKWYLKKLHDETEVRNALVSSMYDIFEDESWKEEGLFFAPAQIRFRLSKLLLIKLFCVNSGRTDFGPNESILKEIWSNWVREKFEDKPIWNDLSKDTKEKFERYEREINRSIWEKLIKIRDGYQMLPQTEKEHLKASVLGGFILNFAFCGWYFDITDGWTKIDFLNAVLIWIWYFCVLPMLLLVLWIPIAIFKKFVLDPLRSGK